MIKKILAFIGAFIAAGAAWAGFVSVDSANPTTVFTGVSLSEIGTKYTIRGSVGGGWVTSKGRAGVYNITNDGTTLTAQFQRVDGNYCKCVIVEFTQSGDDIVAVATAAKYAAASNVGSDFTTIETTDATPVSSASGGGYGAYNLSLALTYKNTGTTAGTYVIQGGYAAQPTWKLNIPEKSPAASDALVKVDTVRIGSRTTTWNTQYDSAYITVDGVTCNAITTYAPYTLAYNSATTCKALEYVFAQPLLVNVGTDYNANFYYADGTQAANGNNPGGAYLIKTADNEEYALRMPNVHSSGWRPVQEVDVLVAATATAAADSTWSNLSWTNGASDWTSAYGTPAVVTVTDNCTINIDTAVNVDSVVFNVAEGKTLTLTGSAITADNGITVKDGTVSVSAAGILNGTVYGNGTVQYNGVRPTTTGTDVVFTDSRWTGTVRITGYNYDNAATGTDRQLFPQYWGSANSKIAWNGVCGYFGSCTSAAGWILEDLTVDSTTYPALRKNDGGSSALTTAPTLSGSGEFADASSPTERFQFTDASGFTGAITITSSSGYGMNVQFGATGVTKVDGAIHVLSGATATIAAGKTWAAPAGIVVSGTLSLGAGSTAPSVISASGTIAVASGTASIGTVPSNEIPCTLDIAEGATLAVADAGDTSFTVDPELATWSGTLDLSSWASLATLNVELGDAETFDVSKFALPATCTRVLANMGESRDLSSVGTITGAGTGVTVAYAVTETRAEYGLGSLTVENVPEGAALWVERPDGSLVEATVSGTTATLSEGIVIDGAATAYDVTFTNTVAMAYARSYAFVRGNDATSSDYNNTAADKTTGIYLYKTPWLADSSYNLNDLDNFQNAMTLAVVGQMPSTQDNVIFIHLGHVSRKGLLITRSATDNEVIVAYNNGNAVTKLTTITVPNASTSRHVYVITKVDDTTENTTTFTIYLDGKEWTTVQLDEVFTLNQCGVQVGSDFGNGIRGVEQADGTIYRQVSSTSDTGYVNCIRLYDRVLTQAEIDQYSVASEYPYVTAAGLSSRTLTGASESWIQTNAWTIAYADGSTTTASEPAAGSQVTITTTGDHVLSAPSDANKTYETLSVNGTGTVEFDSGTYNITTASFDASVDVTVKDNSVYLGGARIEIDSGATLTLDYTDFAPPSSRTTWAMTTGYVTGGGTIAKVDSSDPLYATILAYNNAVHTYTVSVGSDHYGQTVYWKNGGTQLDADTKVVVRDGETETDVSLFTEDVIVFDAEDTVKIVETGDTAAIFGGLKVVNGGSLTLSGGGLVDRTVVLAGGSFDADSTVAMSGTITFQVDSGNYTIFGDGAPDLSAVTILKTGAGTLTIGGNAGTVQKEYVDEGVLEFADAATVASEIRVSSGAVARFSGNATLQGWVGGYNGTGTLNIPANAVFTSVGKINIPVTGAGRLLAADGIYTNILNETSIAALKNSSGWTGTLHLDGLVLTENTPLSSYGNSASTIEMSACSGYLGRNSNLGTLALTGDSALTINNGYSNNTNVFAALTGTGTFSIVKPSGNPTERIIVKSASDFYGSFLLDSANAGSQYGVYIGNVSAITSDYMTGRITIDSSATINLAEGKEWFASGGIEVYGKVNISGGSFSGAVSFCNGASIDYVGEIPQGARVKLAGFDPATTTCYVDDTATPISEAGLETFMSIIPITLNGQAFPSNYTLTLGSDGIYAKSSSGGFSLHVR